MRHHGNKVCLELAQFLFVAQGAKQFGLNFLPLADVQANRQNVWLPIDLHDVSGEQHTVNRVAAVAKTALSMPNTTLCIQLFPKSGAFLCVCPKVEFNRGSAKHFCAGGAEPLQERF